MAGKQSQYERTLERLAKDYGPSVLRGLTPEDLVRILTPEVIQGLSEEAREKLRQLLNGQGKPK